MGQTKVHATIQTAAVKTASGVNVAQTLSALVIALTVLAAAGGLFIPGLYREPATIALAMQGQDLVTLLAMPVFAFALYAAGRGSLRARLVWVGLLGYVCYTYTGAALAFYFNQLFLVYVALFSLSVFALVTAVGNIDLGEVRRRFGASTPRKPVAVFMVFIALILAPMELAEIIPALAAGTVPAIVAKAGTPIWYPHVLDLGIVVPLAILSAVWLWQRLPWGYVLASFVLIKGAAMGLALVAMEVFAVGAGKPVGEWALVGGVIAGGSLGLSFWFLRHCDD